MHRASAAGPHAGSLSRNVVTNYAARFSSIGVTIILFPLIAAHVGMAVFGLWLLISSFTLLFTLDFGLGLTAVRSVTRAWHAGDSRRLNRVASTTAALLAALGLTLASLLVLAMALSWNSLDVPPDQGATAAALVLMTAVSYLVLGLPLTVFREVLIGVQRLDLVNIVQLGQSALRLVLTLLVIVLGEGIIAIAAIETGLVVLASAATCLMAYRVLPSLAVSPRHVSRSVAREMAGMSAALTVISVSAVVILQSDNLIVGLFLPVATVALYSAALRIYSFCRDLTNALTLPLIPASTHADVRQDSQRLTRLLLVGTRYSNALMLGIGGAVAVAAAGILAIWAGDSFQDATPIVHVLILCAAVNTNHLVAMAIMTGLGNLSRYAVLHVLWVAGNVLLSVFLVQRLGAVGVAWGTLIPLALLEPFYVGYALRQLRVTPRAFVRSAVVPAVLPAVAALVAACSILFVAPSRAPWIYLMCGAVYALVYFGLFVLRGLDQTHSQRLLNKLGTMRREGVVE